MASSIAEFMQTLETPSSPAPTAELAKSPEELWPRVRQHARTQAEVARIIFGNVLTGAAVTYPGMGIVAWVYHGTISRAWLYGAIAFVCLVQTLILLQWRHYNQHVQRYELAGDFAWSVGHLRGATWLNFTMASSISLLAMVLAQSSLPASPMVASVMLLIYLVGATVADFIHRPSITAYPIILLTPMGLLHAFSGQPTQWAIATFFVFYFFGVMSYSIMYSKRLQLSIYQRFELDELAKRLDVQRAQAEAQREQAEALRAVAEEQRARAQEAHDAKTRFFTATSHDVRQPLQAMSIMIDAMRSELVEPAQQQRLLHDMEISMDALRSLFDQVLEVSRLDAGTVQLQPRAVRLADLFARLQARFMLQAAAKRVRMRFHCPMDVWVTADPLALERMVANLVGNALKHTSAGGAVWVGWRGQRGRIEVRDNGVGIAPSEQQRIFEEFYQVGNQDRAQGLGLGLAIARRLAALSGQHMGVRSAPGRGSTFWLTQEPAPLVPYEFNLETKESLPAKTPLEGMPRGKVLYVENDERLLTVTTRLLRLNGWQIYPFSNPQQAVDWLLAGNNCDLLLTDYRMSEQWDGLRLIEATRALPGRAWLPAIVMTGDGAVAELASFTRLQHGEGQPSARLLHKPVKTIELLQALEQALQHHMPQLP
jgi:two-component system, sensor histidine kinase